jgi:P-type Ca2+ transporter type 2B
MASKKKSAKKTLATDGGGDPSKFGITVQRLKSIMQSRGKDFIEKFHSPEYDGMPGLLEKLKADGTKGLESTNTDDIEQRREVFGKNEVPPKPLATFLALCWEARHDFLLVILLTCAVISIALSFYKPPHEDGDEPEESE